LRELQARNLARAERLGEKLQTEASAPTALAPRPDGSPPDAEAQEIQKQRLELAGQLLTLALGRMDEVNSALGKSGGAHWSTALEGSRAAVGHLEALRRLFFTIVEELRELAQQQLDLLDATQDAAALADPSSDDHLARIGPLAPRQTELASQAGVIANALAEQSDQAGGVTDQQADSAETNRRLREAGEHVLLAQIEMEGAAAWLGEDPPQLEPTPTRQSAAIEELEQALALLVPPEQREEQDDSESSDPSESGEGEQQQNESEPQSESADPAQLLQAVRDREAQRRHEREQQGAAGHDTVEKDW
jgi:hypothetical protein